MSNITIELRPPPNVDFVHGFPGIPPSGPDRPQAAVKGAIEVRVLPAGGVKAKWVKVELRKVEVLPPGGDLNVFWDCVGPAPVSLWTSPDEYGTLRTQDFPFSIRIPESIPPSVELDNRASISYELVASVCTKGKRGFLRKAKSIVSTAKAPITIDKHELHSTWPIYNQPEVRHLAQDGISLMVERAHTCFGPGDRIAVTVTVKSDSLHTVILRGFEIALKEKTELRAGPHGARGRVAPQARTVTVSENKVMLNATMYGGQSKTADLSCILSPKHTTPTLNAARHIDVTYTLMVKAVMGTGDNIAMDLPVIISNWQRDVSASAIQQIGPTLNLSILPGSTPTATHHPPNQGFYNATHTSNTGNRTQQQLPPQASSTLPQGHNRQNSAGMNMFATANPAGGVGSGVSKLPVDEFGYSSSSNGPTAATIGGGRPVVAPINTGNTTGVGARPGSRGNQQHRLTIMNAHPSEYQDDSIGRSGYQPQQSQQQSQQQETATKQWPSAEEEKRLYEQARRRVETTQGPGAAPAPISHSPPPGAMSSGSGSGSGGGSSSAAGAGGSSSAAQNRYLTAEEEKVMLFNKAQAAVLRAQGIAPTASAGGASSSSSSNSPNHARTPSDGAGGSSAGGSSGKPTGAQLYQQAMAARKNPPPTQATAIPNTGSSSIPAYRTAEQEKAALRRYEEARMAVDRTQGNVSGGGPELGGGSSSALGGGGGAGRDSAPIAYDALFPSGGSSHQQQQQQPPPFQGGGGGPAVGPVAILSEKERLRREYEARDAAALAAQQQNAGPPPPSFSAAPPPPFTPTPPQPAQYANAIAEKEALRRKFEAQDRAAAAAAAQAPPPVVPNLPPPAPLQTPSRNSSAAGFKPASAGAPGTPIYTAPLSPGARPAPAIPNQPQQRILTAAEEKALLRAKYDAQDNAAASPPAPPPARPVQPLQPQQQPQRQYTNGSAFGGGAPPPLMPRPPVEYIQETREADARVNAQVNGVNGNGVLDGKPFTPFNAEFDGLRTPAPALPPKPSGE